MDLSEIETPRDAKDLMEEENFWVETGFDAKLIFIDANFIIITLILIIDINKYTTSVVLISFTVLSVLARMDITVGEAISRLRMMASFNKIKRL